MGRRVLQIVLLFASAAVTVAIFAVAPTPIHNRLAYGTFDTTGAPPRVDYCGRRYYPSDQPKTETLAEVETFLARDGLHGLTQVDTAPSGMPVVTNVIPPEVRAQYHTNVCTMVLWVKTGSDAYVGYSLSGGP
ncbi:MAG: hypothetical protein E6I61_00130 [Chloroflexi bacterium]|nr:MAG: hypothetical protein E6I71_02250 [Chloroflexota bacterium]TME43366.1 MAG: hypothetical protein E6I61_00130 [Chloroflexota bacterium]TME49648.1 MAG: hypothetical protein E6I53_15230 [Chloroflexota bacterium]